MAQRLNRKKLSIVPKYTSTEMVGGSIPCDFFVVIYTLLNVISHCDSSVLCSCQRCRLGFQKNKLDRGGWMGAVSDIHFWENSFNFAKPLIMSRGARWLSGRMHDPSRTSGSLCFNCTTSRRQYSNINIICRAYIHNKRF